MSDGELTGVKDMGASTGLTPVEEYSPAAYILLVAGILCVLETVPGLLDLRSGATGILLLLGILVTYVLIWWTAVRRRQYSIWWTALQLTLAADIAGVISVLVSLATLDDAAGRFRWPDLFKEALFMALVMSVPRFLVSAVAIAVGRHLPGGRPRPHS